MANLDDNMGDFFRKKLNDGSGDEHWDRPDSSVRNQLLSDISTKNRFFQWRSYWPAAVLILLFLTWGYSASLCYETNKQSVLITSQKNEIDQQAQLIQTLNTDKQKAQNCQRAQESAEKEILQLKNALTTVSSVQNESEKQYEALQRQHQQAIESIQQLQSALIESQFTLKQNKEELDNYNAIAEGSKEKVSSLEGEGEVVENKPELNGEKEIMALPKANYDLLSIKKPMVKQEDPQPIVLAPSFSPEKPLLKLGFKKTRFELGYSSGFSQMKLPQEIKSETENMLNQSEKYPQAIGYQNKLNFGLSLSENLWLETGFNHSFYKVEQNYDLNLVYNEAGEYQLPTGATAKNIELQTNSFSGDIEHVFQLIQRNNDLEEEDILLFDASEEMSLSRLQLPLGIAYQFGENSWKLRLQTGLAWNLLQLRDYELELELELEDEDLELEYNPPNFNRRTTQYLSSYIGVTVFYQVADNWQLTASFRSAYNFLPKLDNALERNHDASFNQNINLGFNYQF